jgi:DNA-binding ferritin-like protein
MNPQYLQIAIQLRAMQMFYHSAHHLSSRVAFFSDHEAFGAFYEACNLGFDNVMERMIGLHGPQSAALNPILQAVAQKCATLPSVEAKDDKQLFEAGLKLEQELCSMIDQVLKSGQCTEGTRQMLGDEANFSEGRQFKIKMRIKG